MKAICIVCQKDFIKLQNKKTCSDSCRHKYYKEYHKSWSVNKIDHLNSYRINYKHKNANRLMLYRKKRYLQNKDNIIKKQKVYIKLNREKIYLRNKKYRLLHPEMERKSSKKYREKNKEILAERRRLPQNLAKRRNYLNKYLATNINYKISHLLRSRLNKVLQTKSHSESALDLLGCSIEYFKTYIEKQFSTGMSWNNHGNWHIDHIKPCYEFDLTIPSERRKCFHYTNLQPLWAKDNLKKNRFYYD